MERLPSCRTLLVFPPLVAVDIAFFCRRADALAEIAHRAAQSQFVAQPARTDFQTSVISRQGGNPAQPITLFELVFFGRIVGRFARIAEVGRLRAFLIGVRKVGEKTPIIVIQLQLKTVFVHFVFEIAVLDGVGKPGAVDPARNIPVQIPPFPVNVVDVVVDASLR